MQASVSREHYNRETYFPLSLVGEVTDILRRRGCEFRRYRDFHVPLFTPRLDRLSYQIEYLQFSGHGAETRSVCVAASKLLLRKLRSLIRLLAKGRTSGGAGAQSTLRLTHRAPRNPVAIFQHDADQQPYKTVDMMLYEAELGVVSSSYFFVKQNGDPGTEPYVVDVERLRDLEVQGFEIGYHLNALELAAYDVDRAFQIIEHDVAWFRERFDLRTFVPHGGRPGPRGENNEMIPYRGILRSYGWAYNGRGVASHHIWSDGHIGFEPLEDPRALAERVQPGERAIFLMHPQYYGDRLSPAFESLPLARCTWWRELWGI